MRSFLAIGLWMLASVAHADDKAVQQLLDRAVKAQGGAEKSPAMKNFIVKGTASMEENGQPKGEITFNMSVRGFDSIHGELTMMRNGMNNQATLVIVGDKGWARDGNSNRLEEAPAEVIPQMQVFLMAIRAPASVGLLSQNKAITLGHGGESQVGDRTAEVLRISQKDRKDVVIYFDKMSGRPLKAETYMKQDAGAEEKLITFEFGEFKEVNGVTLYQKIVVQQEGEFNATIRFNEFSLNAAFDAKLFEKP